ncbi:G1/S-specific cyclin-E1-like [Dermacentor silvarum]|uniref:G1/S-specific cyclin-E1-like n=1 Tax=Dermacentor silvarum TaxID=543639 RepID=UPI00189AB62C|nr:G1/S-specific cyclin-E1-like [Dermacentor silvarum]
MSKRYTKATRSKRSRGSADHIMLRKRRRAPVTAEETPSSDVSESFEEAPTMVTCFGSPDRSSTSCFSSGGTPKSYSQFRGIHGLPTPEPRACRNSPLPQFSWADQENVWSQMVRKDLIYVHSASVLERHPALQPRMRAILLDWLIEVCEVYRLHRDTYYLAQDILDRYLAKSSNLPKNQLQLLGITALFLAAKMEEIYPPKLAEFAYVTDGACQESEILDKELSILVALNWDLTPVTVNGWLNTYLQIAAKKEKRDKEDMNFLHPGFSACSFVQVAQLVDLCMLDVDCLQFAYSAVAASAIHHMMSPTLASAVSGYKTADLADCIEWMAPFATVIKEGSKDTSGTCGKSGHEIQVHHVNLQLVERAFCLKKEASASAEPKHDKVASGNSTVLGLLTPPAVQ